MSDSDGDYFADLTTAPIFDDAIYRTEALQLSDVQDEEELDDRLALSAREAGVEDPTKFLHPSCPDISIALSTMTVSSVQRSSVSIHSRASRSTGMTSQPSRTSRDHTFGEFPSPNSRPIPRSSLSLDYYDSVLERFRPSVRHRPSSSNVSRSGSVFSDSSSLPAPPSWKQKRTSGMFSMFRRNSSTCSTPIRHSHHSKTAGPKLDCGHSLTKDAVRAHVQEALRNSENIAPNCCGKPLPRTVLRTVLTRDELEHLVNRTNMAGSPKSQRDSGFCEDSIANIPLPDSKSELADSLQTGPEESSGGRTPDEDNILHSALENEAFKALYTDEQAEFDRIARFECHQRKALAAHHQWTLNRLSAKLASSKVEISKQHVQALENLEEAQIIAEHDLRKTQAQETQNVATALKYMEAYCAGTNPLNPDLVHAVTDEDHKKLARQRLIQEKLPAKHESAINVLRARQEKDLEQRLEKQETELFELDTEFERSNKQDETRFLAEVNKLADLVTTRRKHVTCRWDLRFEIWRRSFETQHGMTLVGRLPHAEWPQIADDDLEVDPQSALAVYFGH